MTRFFGGAAFRVVVLGRVGQHHQFVAVRSEQQGFARVVSQLIEGHGVATDLDFGNLAELRVIQCNLRQRLEQFGQTAAIHHQQKILQATIRPTPQRHVGRLIEKRFDQAVLQLQIMLVDDPAQATDQAETIGVGFVIEDEIFGERGFEERHGQQVFGQLAQGMCFEQRVRAAQAELVTGQFCWRRLGFEQQPAKTTRHAGHQAQPGQQQWPAPRGFRRWRVDSRSHSVFAHLFKARFHPCSGMLINS